MSPPEQKALRVYLDEIIATGKIRPSTSPAAAPILFVPKKDRSLRLCVDYRGLNAVTKKNRYPLPLMDELADATKGATLFTKIDLKNGYNLVRIAEGEEWKTAFRTKYGHFEYLVMPFGLTNAPATFQAMMNTIFADLLDNGVVIYLDDILIYSKTRQEHVSLVQQILSRLRANGLFGNIEKTLWFKEEVEFLGYILSGHGTKLAQSKAAAIAEWAPPTKVKELQGFLGFANLPRRFIHRYSEITRPLTDLLKKDHQWRWGPEQEAAFELLKERFTQAPNMRHYDPDREAILETDASDWGEAAVLSQLFDDGLLHPVAYHSRKFNEAEVNYEIYDKEMLAIVDALLTWRHWLEGTEIPIQIYSDHQNLQFFTTTKKLSRRQARWSEKIGRYKFKIHFRPGANNGKPDSMTRRPEFAMEGGVMREQPIKQLLTPEHFARRTAPDKKSWTALGDWQQLPPIQDREEDLGWKISMRQTAEDPSSFTWTPDEATPLHESKWIVPGHARKQVIHAHHDIPMAGHMGRDKTLELIDRNHWWPKMAEDVASYIKSCDT